jgi:hypothetical protein
MMIQDRILYEDNHVIVVNKLPSEIVQGDKIKWVYLKDNPYQMEAIAFLEFDLPQKMKDFINEYIDRGKSFETILQNKLQGFYDDLEWSLPPANPLIHKFFTFS